MLPNSIEDCLVNDTVEEISSGYLARIIHTSKLFCSQQNEVNFPNVIGEIQEHLGLSRSHNAVKKESR